jgi:hypothetical protein
MSQEELIKRGTIWVQRGHICDCCVSCSPEYPAEAVNVTVNSNGEWALLCNECLERNKEEHGKMEPPVTFTVFYTLPEDYDNE